MFLMAEKENGVSKLCFMLVGAFSEGKGDTLEFPESIRSAVISRLSHRFAKASRAASPVEIEREPLAILLCMNRQAFFQFS